MRQEDALQIDIMLQLSSSGGHENIITAMHVFSRCLLLYPVTNANSISVAKMITDIMTWHAYLVTKIITDLSSVLVLQSKSQSKNSDLNWTFRGLIKETRNTARQNQNEQYAVLFKIQSLL